MILRKLPFIPFSKPFVSDSEINSVIEVMKSGWLTTGSKSKKFEEVFNKFISPDDHTYSISVNSATAGLHLALEACGISKGDEVITSTLTFTATAEVVRYLGAEVKLVDIDPETMNIDANKIEEAISSKTKALMPVHYAGLSCDMDKIISIAKKHNLKVIEDAAHALPSNFKNKRIGSLDTDCTVFSFYANKNMTTGEGGMVVTKKEDIKDRIKLMRLHGIDRDAFNRFTDSKASWYYEVVEAGFKYNLTDIAAAMGIEQLKKLPSFLKDRQQQAKLYFEKLQSKHLILPYPGEENSHSWHLFVIRLKEGAPLERGQLIAKLQEKGIGTSVHYMPLHLQPYWKNRYQLKEKNFPNAQSSYEKMISIPLYPGLGEENQLYIIETINNILNA